MSPERDVPVAKGRSLYHFMSLVMYLHSLSLPPLFRLHCLGEIRRYLFSLNISRYVGSLFVENGRMGGGIHTASIQQLGHHEPCSG
jgi:hypothetical protein